MDSLYRHTLSMLSRSTKLIPIQTTPGSGKYYWDYCNFYITYTSNSLWHM